MLNRFLDFISESIPQTIAGTDEMRNQNHSNAMLYFRLKNEDGSYSIKFVNIQTRTQFDLLCKYSKFVEQKLSGLQSEDYTIKHIDEYDYTETKNIYYFNNEELGDNNEIEFLKNDHINNNDHFNMNDLSKINGIIIRIGNTEFMNLYIPYFSIYSLAPDKWIVLSKEIDIGGINDINDQFISNENNKIIRFNYNVAFIYFENKLLVLDFKKLETEFNYSNKMLERATEKIGILNTHGLLSNNSTIDTLIESNSSLVKKLLKIKETSPVFSVPKTELVNFVRLPSNQFKIQISDTGEFEVNTLAKARIFLKIIDDDYVKSELTGVKYDAEKKNDIIDSE